MYAVCVLYFCLGLTEGIAHFYHYSTVIYTSSFIQSFHLLSDNIQRKIQKLQNISIYGSNTKEKRDVNVHHLLDGVGYQINYSVISLDIVSS